MLKDTLTSADYRVLSRALAVGFVASESAARECAAKGYSESAEFHRAGMAKVEAAYAVINNLRTEY